MVEKLVNRIKREIDIWKRWKEITQLINDLKTEPSKKFKEKNKLILMYQIMNQTTKRVKCQVYSRVVGYLSSTDKWNKGKVSEWSDRKVFKIK